MNRKMITDYLPKPTNGRRTFKGFDGRISITYDQVTSRNKNKDYWRVDNDFYYYVGDPSDCIYVYVKAGFRTDGASVPRPFWALIPPWGSHGNAAIVHDYLCETKTIHEHGAPKKIDNKRIDKIFMAAMKVSGVGFKRYVIYAAVRLASWIGLR